MWLMPAGLRQAVQEFLGLVPAAVFEPFASGSRSPTCFCMTRGHRAHPLQHARIVDVRHGAGAHVGHDVFPALLLRDRYRGGHDDDSRLVRAVSARRRAHVLTVTIGASGAIYGLLLAYGLTFPNRPIYIYFIFAIPAKYFVMIIGLIALLSAAGESGSGIAHITHLGGLVAGFVLLRGRHLSPANEVRYRYLRWKMDRARKKFGVYSGGQKDWDKQIH